MEKDSSLILKGALHADVKGPIPVETFIYLATPYSDPSESVREFRYVQAKRIAGKLIAAGLPTFSPIAHCHSIARTNALPTDAEFWWDYNLRFMKTCSLIAVAYIDGWERSVGVERECTWAHQNKKPILAVDVTEDGPQFSKLD